MLRSPNKDLEIKLKGPDRQTIEPPPSRAWKFLATSFLVVVFFLAAVLVTWPTLSQTTFVRAFFDQETLN